ncbi:jacalin-like lectin [Pseudoxanthomonas wuyuanensis]|uniref:Jacalin-like lectin domain-containing protein n=1 Tax=Pseudoxanthomonas wuyuanensis TaxID=1073196 RepID=A0A286D6M1_9GAMM|nr:endonuclease [Pseudoxanthomonas wuyuanensis]SOD54309.1 Jacalin-like lectin domain-containing protein [Pseudoxanthomonas wuyuanensis]
MTRQFRIIRACSLSLALAFGLASQAAAQTQSEIGVLDVLSYNIAGLPEGLSSGNPETNTPLLAPKLAAFDLVHVQEDFNYHAALYAGDTHPYRTPTSGGAAFGDGLNTLSSYPFSEFTRVKWNQCNGTDCLTPKGFTFMRLRLAEGQWLDVYNAHPNAGVGSADLAARRNNISQMSQFIQNWSAGNPVLVMMDSNTRYTRSEDNIRELIQANNLRDPWIELVKGTAPATGTDALLCGTPPSNDCEVVDKILYRDAPNLLLVADSYSNDDARFYNEQGQPLSDHYPLFTRFGWAAGEDVRTSDTFGGPHGTPFNDLASPHAGRPIHVLTLRGGSRLDAVALTLGNGVTLGHGGTGGTEKSLSLRAGEKLVSMTFTLGKRHDRTRVFSLEVHTNQGRRLQAGSPTADSYTLTAPAGWHIAGFNGRAGDEIDKLGAIYMKE